MEHILPESILEQIWFVDSLWLSFLRQKKVTKSAMKNFFGSPDLGRHVFSFFPIVDSRDHWTLMALYNPHCLRLNGLPRKRVCEYFGKYCIDSTVQSELLDPANLIGSETIE
ncbi:hypothetical protein L7F22_065774, partial [Adiantum nelumboides]|nr:hypothetical protein [Adiantum nelumboides]